MKEINKEIILNYLKVFYPVNRIKNKGRFKRCLLVNGKHCFLTNMDTKKQATFTIIDDVSKVFYLPKKDSIEMVGYYLNIKL
jgi:hypothetical protein